MTPTIKTDQIVLKTDEIGRVRTPAARREALLLEFERSGLTGAKFAALAGIKYSTFAAWLQKRRRQGDRGEIHPRSQQTLCSGSKRLVEQAHNASNQSCSLVLELPGGARAQIGSVDQLALAAALLRALEKPC